LSAESVDHIMSMVFSGNDYQKYDEFYNQVETQQIKVTHFQSISDDRTMFKYQENRNNKEKVLRPNLHKGYLPCAVFVPMYGQLM
jgi:hypothetical protein